MKIGMLTQWYDPETGPASLPAVYAREFVSQGHQVRVLTGFPNYPEGKLYEGFRMRPRSFESHGEARVTRVALYPNHSSSALGRMANYGSFSLSASTLGAFSLRDSDAMWVYNSPVTVALPMLLHSRFGHKPVFLHVQDLWPDSLIESGMFPGGKLGSAASSVVSALVRLMEKRAAVVGVISRSVRDLILERNPGLDPEKVIYVPNPTNESLFRPVSELLEGTTLGARSSTHFMYAGAIGNVQGLDTLLDAAKAMLPLRDISISLVGDGIARARLEERVRDEGIRNVSFLGRLPQSDIPRTMAKADVQLVSLAANPFLAYTTPSKISALLASEMPILAQLAGDGARLLTDSGAAFVTEPGSVEELVHGLCDFADLGQAERTEMGKRGGDYYRKNLSASAAATAIVDSLNRHLQ
ncbi:MAG: glycosyltransferase family 4 protein [Propionibacteriaceae bacterium]|nr:glycosyltransferase family 4 protein [Propionibacteriaceae bacterium]